MVQFHAVRQRQASGNCPSSFGRRAPRASRFTRTMKSKVLRKSAPGSTRKIWIMEVTLCCLAKGNFIQKLAVQPGGSGESPTNTAIQRDFSGSKMGIANVPAIRGPFKHQSPWDLETPVVKWEQRDHLKVCPARWSPEKQIVSVRLQLSKFLRLWWMYEHIYIYIHICLYTCICIYIYFLIYV